MRVISLALAAVISRQSLAPPRGLILVLALVALTIVGSGALISSRNANASHGDLGFLWYSNTSSAEKAHDDTTSADGWGAAVSAAISDWYNNTVMWPNQVSTSTPAQLHYYSGNYGDSGWLGAANVYSGSTLCLSPGGGLTGLCNKTTVKADSAIFNLNNYYWSPWGGPAGTETYHKQRTSAHELGHAWGMSHEDPSCSDSGILALMKISGCYLWGSSAPQNGVVSSDISHADALY